MANNKLKWIALVLGVLVVFCAGGWFFTSLPRWTTGGGEVEQLYSEDGEAYGIFDNIPPEELAAAEAAAMYGLNQQIVLPEDSAQAQRRDGSELPSQIALTDVSEIAGVAPAAEEENEEGKSPMVPPPCPWNLSAAKPPSCPGRIFPPCRNRKQNYDDCAPVKFFLIKNSDEYKKFKTRARGSYPAVDFTKQMLVVLESDSQLPDNVFEIRSAQLKDGKVHVTYAVSLFDLDKKLNTHAVAAVGRSDADVELEQVL